MTRLRKGDVWPSHKTAKPMLTPSKRRLERMRL